MSTTQDRWERSVLASVAVGALTVLALVVGSTSPAPGSSVPTGLDAALASLLPHTRILDAYGTGGWLAWRHPLLDRYVDGLTDAYSSDHLERYLAMTGGTAASVRLLRQAHITAALLPTESPMSRRLEALGWRRLGADAGYVLLTAPVRPS